MISPPDFDFDKDEADTLEGFYADCFRKAREYQVTMAKEVPSGEEYEIALAELAKEVVKKALAGDEEAKILRACSPQVHEFLSDLFLPGGPFHGVVIDHFGYMPNDSLRAPLLQLYLQHPGELQGLQEPIFNHLAWLYIESREGTPAKDRVSFEEDMCYLAGKLGPVHYKPLVADVMRNFGQFVRNYTVLDKLHDAGGLETLLKWDADILTVCDRGMIHMPKCLARPPMYAKLVHLFVDLTKHLVETGRISQEQSDQRRGVLLQAGLEASGKLKNKMEAKWRPILDLVVEYKNQPLTPRQLLSYVKHFPDNVRYAEALAELKAFGSEEVVKAIQTDYVVVEQAERIRTVGVEDGIDPNKLLRLTGEAFSRDLGL